MVSRKPHPDELRERAVKMVLEVRAREGGKGHSELWPGWAVSWAHPRRCAAGSSRPRSIVGRGRAPRRRTSERIAELEREVRELRRANEILKAASAYFARELDPRLPR